MREFTSICSGSKLLPTEDIFNSLVFHTNSAADLGFAGVSDTVPDVSLRISVTVFGMWGEVVLDVPPTVCLCAGRGRGSGSKYLPLYTSKLLLVRVSQNCEKTEGIRVLFNYISLSTQKSIYHIPIVVGLCSWPTY